MKIKKFAITALIIFPLIVMGCSDSNKENATVKVDFSGASIVESFAAIQGISPAAGSTSAIPVDVDKIKITITQGTEVVYNHTFTREAIANASDTVTIDIPAGTDLVFTVTCYNIGGIALYTGTSGTIEITAGTEISVPITLTPVVLNQDAAITLNLKELNASTVFASKSYYNTIVADVLSVSATTQNGETTVTTQSISNVTSSTFTTSITGLTAYPHIFQFILVKVLAPDGTIASIGAAFKPNLVSGTNNPFNVIMFPPGRLNIINNTTITSYNVQIDFGSGYVTIPSDTTPDPNDPTKVLVLVPNCRTDIGKYNGTTVNTIAHNFRVTVNGQTKVISTPVEINWKRIDLDFANNTWTQNNDK